ncbi:MAG TPA: CHASE3 domain-containing protein [Aliidongia sp.]|uniref:CHASE3 domain-containing protein n=1 Tax=Aliidongia sp. TaxID=1914230 RepID=UPI002DDDB223|nr:CHASE3 domain-containing protein [Aliidongia sp.]HEV2677929.1 CHASE3 domain-containing protein [Aliidongia sp.]
MAAVIAKANAMVLAGLVALVAIIALVSYDHALRFEAARDAARHSRIVVDAVQDLRSAVQAAETGQRGYLLTGREEYLAPYHGALTDIAVLQGRLSQLIGNEPAQQKRVEALTQAIQEKLSEIAHTIELRTSYGVDASLHAVDTDIGLRAMERIMALLGEMQSVESARMEQGIATADAAEVLTRWWSIGGTALAILLLGFGAWLLRRSFGDLRTAQSEARSLALHLQSSFDSLSQGIAVFDAERQLVHWNGRFTQLLDLPPSLQVHGTSYLSLGHFLSSEDRPPFFETEEQIVLAESGRSRREPVVYERSLGGRIFEVRRTPMPDGGFVVTCTDLTDRVTAERTLREAQKMQAIGQLTGGVAHDFNNLLTVILGNLEAMQALLGQDHPIVPRIESAARGAERGASLTRHLLAFARRQPLEPKPVSLRRLFTDMTGLLRRTLGEHIDVRVVETAGLWDVLADPAQVESAVLNLAINARDAMPSGGRLTIETANVMLDETYARGHVEVTAGDYVMIAVTDTGTGMTPEVIDRAFEPFFTTKDAGRGTGLGLSMVFGFAKQSFGHVKIYSELGHGTSVKLYLPRVVGVSTRYERPVEPLELPRTSATILVVEDDEAVREVVVMHLRDFGYSVIEAGDGAEALERAGGTVPIDMVLTDVVLPGTIRGKELVRRLTDLSPGLKVLFMSGYTENAIVHHGKLDDGVQLLSKPFKRDQLARKVAEVLGTDAAEDDNVVQLNAVQNPKG